MLILLPPSETKRDGGAPDTALDLGALSFPALTSARSTALAAVASLGSDPEAAAAALKIGPKLAFELDRNNSVDRSPLLPAMDRYTGVLYDALDAPSLDAAGRLFLADNAVIASALFGLLRAGDPIPAYRLSHDSRIGAVRMKALWRAAITEALASHDGLILDLRSESYVELGPVPAGANSAYLRVVSEHADGTHRALNHFNKKGKGAFVRALAASGIPHDSVDSLLEWAPAHGVRLAPGAAGEVLLIV
jgi:cytoplasmic iron level regulating protein YaaA (DUF328/UPF0246 family)